MGLRRLDLLDSALHHFLKRCDVRPAQSRSPLAAESSRFYAARTAKNPGFRTKSVLGRGYGMAENDRHFDPLVRITGILNIFPVGKMTQPAQLFD